MIVAGWAVLGTLLFAGPGDTTKVVSGRYVPAAQARLAVDGRMDEPAWQQARPADGFIQLSPRPGAPASQPTEARVLYTEDALYIGLRMHDSRPDSITSQLARRDGADINSDWASVYIDSQDDNRTAYEFSVNPRGVKRDVYHYNDNDQIRSWDAVWDVGVQIDSLGWTAEFRIPLSQLRFRVGGDARHTWGINFGREIARYGERSFWSPVEPNSSKFVSFFGTLTGLEALRPPGRLELQPYALTRYTRAPGDAEDPFYRENELNVAVGAELEYGLTSGMSLTATINPDFGQVEADPSEVNLTAFETFRTERRPFFNDAADLFGFGLGQVSLFQGEQLFYSRRIGRAPQGVVSIDGFVDAPEATTVLGAAKLSGKTASGWSISVLNAVTGQENARVFAGGADTVVAVEPLTNYGAARVSRNFRRGRSSLGAIFTSVHRNIESGSGLDLLHSAAYVGGLDGRHRFGGGDYEATARAAVSHVRGTPRALLRTQRSSVHYLQRPDLGDCWLCLDLDSTRTSLTGAAGLLRLQKIGGGNWRASVVGTARTPGLEVNDAGFQRLADAVSVLADAEYVRSSPGSVFRNWVAGLQGGTGWTFGGEQNLEYYGFYGSFQLQNLWSGDGGMVRLPGVLSPTTLRGGPALRTPDRVLALLNFSSDARRTVHLGLSGSVQVEQETDGYTWNVSPVIAARPSTRAELSLAPLVERNRSSWQYLATRRVSGETRYVGGKLEQTSLALTARLEYAFSPELTLQLYARPFVSAGEFSDFREAVDPRAHAFEQRFRPISGEDLSLEPDFNRKDFGSNVVLRWEYRAGSTLFVVWGQGRSHSGPDGGLHLSSNTRELLGTPGTNVLLIKASYWLNR
jgi:hypothetical protein